MDLKYEEYAKAFIAAFDPEFDRVANNVTPMPHIEYNTRVAEYVWLPIRFDGEMAYLDWKEEWRIEDYE